MESDLTSMPWDEKPSIYEHIRAHVVYGQPGLSEGADPLPDDDRINKDATVRFASGALDGIMTHHFGAEDNEKAIQESLGVVLAYCREPTAANKAAVHNQIVGKSLVSMIDGLIQSLVHEERIEQGRLYELARSFAVESPDREPVKFGIAILGVFGQTEDADLFQILGRHDEFTLFAAVALGNTCEPPDQALWTLARNVEGWGRIHVVERLAKTESPEIKDWLLREGFRNSIMYEYLACTCARAGGLLSALSADRIDRELLTAVGEILQALISRGPAEGMDDYEEGAAVVEMYLAHIESAAESLADFEHVNAIRIFLDDESTDWTSRLERGWSTERRAQLKAICDAILNRPEWPRRARDGLSSRDALEFQSADRAAKFLGIDTWPAHWRRLQEKPLDSGTWYHLMELCTEERIEAVVEAAEQLLDLSRIGTGARDELGVGPGYEPHLCLSLVLQGLRRFPGHGSNLIQAGLKSPSIQNRNAAMVALSAWGRETWPDAIRSSLEQAADAEPKEAIRRDMHKVLNGEPLEDS